jgi:hypothetical protein
MIANVHFTFTDKYSLEIQVILPVIHKSSMEMSFNTIIYNSNDRDRKDRIPSKYVGQY